MTREAMIDFFDPRLPRGSGLCIRTNAGRAVEGPR